MILILQICSRSRDILEARIRKKFFVRKTIFAGQTQLWNYRSEIVDKLGLDKKHRNIWIAYFVTVLFGFAAFVYVKSNIISSRRAEKEERERIRRETRMKGVQSKKPPPVVSS
ncbi:hypothetical protein DICVIV_12336 [Dictyocaulus viviparus]|uniref:Uncharacterized protein n=1 Tax=Dictyocaulus viviparus TaxID=29172 RepID=A0A0D8XDH6_DICVI|nr:hypothetical protein DICVIV_12336 [Dictyocaulus viviparus]